MSCRIPAWLIPLLAVALWLPARPVQAQIFSGSTQSRMMGRAGQGPNYFAIMGHVKYPQTYLLPTSAPFLADFIRFAGGALETTTGEVRIVRGGRVVQQTTLIAKSTIKLMPGDLVIVDGGRIGRGNIFRGGNNRQGAGADSKRLNQICLVGIQPYPIIMQMTSEVATKRWIVSQLGQNAAIADSIKVIERRNFAGQSGPNTRLSDNSILNFPAGLIDESRLPELPRPFRAGTDRHPDQKPLTGLPQNPNEGSAAAEIPLRITQPLPVDKPDTEQDIDGQDITAPDDSATPPGYSAVPDGREPTGVLSPNPDTTRNLLTHPDSVTLDEKPPTLPGRARLSDSGTASTGRPRSTTRTEQNATAPRDERDTEIRFNADVVRDAEAASSPAAEKPFQSQPDPSLTPVGPEVAPREPATSALPLTPLAPRRTEVESPATAPAPSVQLLGPPPQIPGPVATPENSEKPVVSHPPVQNERAVPAGPSMALNAAAGFAGPTPVTETPAADDSTPRTSAAPNQPVSPTSLPQFTEASVQTRSRSADNLPQDDGVSVIGKSRIIRRKDPASSWPLITAGVIGSLGFLAAFSLLLSMTGPAPPTLAPAEKSDRYWLDKIINDELPVTDEPAAEPVVSKLFGRPTNAPTLRLDAGQSEIPRPHFLDRGRQSGVGQRRSPQPDIPQPDAKRPDSEPGPTTMPPRRTGPPSRGPDVPLAPAAEQQSGAAVAERPATGPKPKQKVVRVDSGHGPSVPSKQPAAAAPKIVVKPAESVAAGSDLLDRILASVEVEKTRTPKKQQKDPS